MYRWIGTRKGLLKPPARAQQSCYVFGTYRFQVLCGLSVLSRQFEVFCFDTVSEDPAASILTAPQPRRPRLETAFHVS